MHCDFLGLPSRLQAITNVSEDLTVSIFKANIIYYLYEYTASQSKDHNLKSKTLLNELVRSEVLTKVKISILLLAVAPCGPVDE